MSEHATASGTLSPHVREEIDHWVAKFPEGRQRSAVIAALHAAQHENGGYLTPELMIAVADYLKLPQIQVFEVASFYSMFETKPVGRHSISVCTNISCMLRGGYEILHHIEQKLGIKPGQTTPDGAFTLVEEECLAACANAPMMICGQDYFLDLTPQKVDTILDDLRRRWREQQKQSPVGGTLHGVGPLPGAKA
jgi:NADH-quinone oxidoreductase subunit E